MVRMNRRDIATTTYVLNELAINNLVPKEITEAIKQKLSVINEELWIKEKEREDEI